MAKATISPGKRKSAQRNLLPVNIADTMRAAFTAGVSHSTQQLTETAIRAGAKMAVGGIAGLTSGVGRTQTAYYGYDWPKWFQDELLNPAGPGITPAPRLRCR